MNAGQSHFESAAHFLVFLIFTFSYTIEAIHLRQEDALQKFVGITLNIHCCEATHFV
jgi:hypothetical protein